MSSEPKLEIFCEVFSVKETKESHNTIYGVAFVPAINGKRFGPGKSGRLKLPLGCTWSCAITIAAICVVALIPKDMTFYTNDGNLDRILNGVVAYEAEGRVKSEFQELINDKKIVFQYRKRGVQMEEEIQELIKLEKLKDEEMAKSEEFDLENMFKLGKIING